MFKHEFSKRPNLILALKSLSYFSIEKLVRLFVGLFLHTWMARELGPVQMGFYSYVTDFVFVFFTVVGFGLDEVLVKELAISTDPGKDLGTVFYFRILFSIFVWIVLAGSIYVIRRESMEVLATVIFGTIIVFRSFDCFASYFQAHLQTRPLVQARQSAYLVTSFLKGLGLWLKWGVGYFLFNYYLLLVLERISVFYKLRKTHQLKFSFDSTRLRRLLTLALPVGLTQFFLIGESRLGTFFLSKYYDMALVGEFGVGRGLLDLALFLPETISTIALPLLLRARGDEKTYRDKSIKFYSLLFYAGLCFAALLSILASDVTNILFGSKYQQVAYFLHYASFISIISFLNSGRVRWYILQNKSLTWLIVAGVTFALNFILQFYLTRMYGIMGPYLSSAISHSLASAFLFIFFRPLREDLYLIFRGIMYPANILLKKFQ